MHFKNAKRLLLCTAAFVGAATVADAAQFHGWYVGVEGGLGWVQDLDAVAKGTSAGSVFGSSNIKAEFETGWALLGTIGYAWDNNFRVEIEGGYRANDIDSLLTPFSSTPVSGELTEYTLMANVLYDLQLTSSLSLTLGAGLGADYADVDLQPFSDGQWAFAYQGIVGLNQKISDQWALFVNYRYLRVTGQDFNDPGVIGPPEVLHIDTDDIEKTTLTVGFRYDLTRDEAPVVIAPAAPPPAAPPPPAQFIVFFGFNKCNITAEADAVLAEAAAAAKSGGASVKIVGHTDTVGSPSYNQKLSECRADAVKSNLVSKGIPDGAISATGKGESELLVQTGDGVKEPQNRRATVDLN